LPIATIDDIKLNYLQLSPQTSVGLDISSGPSDLGNQHSSGDSDLIMVHGLATNLAFWYHLAPSFSEHYRVTLYDLRGHGRSSMPPSGYSATSLAQDLNALMDCLGITTAHLVGHSFGGSVICHFASLFPDRVKSLSLVDVRLKLFQPQQNPTHWPHWETLSHTLEKVGIFLSPEEPEAGYRMLTEVARLQIESPQSAQPFPKLLASLFPQGGSKRTAKQWLTLLDTTNAWDEITRQETFTLDDLNQWTMPLFGIYGEHSPNLPTSRGLQQALPGLILDMVPNAGHFFPVSRPQHFAGRLKAFLDSIDV
jgi:pimeloyl-ACP methyl ester carboxylesterase